MLKLPLQNRKSFNIYKQLCFNTNARAKPQQLRENTEKSFYILLTYFLLTPTEVGFDKKLIRTWVKLGKNMVCSYQGVIVDLFRPFCGQIMLKFNIWERPFSASVTLGYCRSDAAE